MSKRARRRRVGKRRAKNMLALRLYGFNCRRCLDPWWHTWQRDAHDGSFPQVELEGGGSCIIYFTAPDGFKGHVDFLRFPSVAAALGWAALEGHLS